MTVLIDDQFAANVTGWATVGAGTLPTWDSGVASGIAADGSDQAGRMAVAAGNIAERTFSAVTSGTILIEWWVYVPDSATGATRSLFLYMDGQASGTAFSSAASAATLVMSRDTVDGATSTYVRARYRDNVGFQPGMPVARSAWIKLSVVINVTSRAFNFYIDDKSLLRGVTCPSASFTQVSRIGVLLEASGATLYVGNVRVESNWSLTETTLVEDDFTTGATGAIASSTPSTDIRSLYPQPWYVPPNTTSYGNFTRGVNGLAGTSASLPCLALSRCTSEGIVEIEFNTSVAGVRYMGIIGRSWDYPSASDGGSFIFRVSSSDNTAKLFINDAVGAQQIVQSSSLTPTANTVYTLKVECRGRYYICSYKAAALNSGSYTQLWAHVANSSVTGGRGMLSEELFGPVVAGPVDNYVRKMRFTGAVPAWEANKILA